MATRLIRSNIPAFNWRVRKISRNYPSIISARTKVRKRHNYYRWSQCASCLRFTKSRFIAMFTKTCYQSIVWQINPKSYSILTKCKILLYINYN